MSEGESERGRKRARERESEGERERGRERARERLSEKASKIANERTMRKTVMENLFGEKAVMIRRRSMREKAVMKIHEGEGSDEDPGGRRQ